MEVSYYDVLGVTSKVNVEEVKRAYILKVREYPSEKFPEEFKAIRRAYETLSNLKTRHEYDTMSIYGEEIEALNNKAFEAYKIKDFKNATYFYKKILIIEPSMLNIRNYYAMSLIYLNEPEKAIEQLNKILAIENDNAIYMCNLAFAHETIGNIQEAIKIYNQAIDIDPFDSDIVLALSEVYVDIQEFSKARELLNNVLYKNSHEGFHEIVYMFKLLEVDIFSESKENMRETLDRFNTLVEKYPEEKEYVTNQISKLVFELIDNNQRYYALKLVEKGLDINPNHEKLLYLYDYTSNQITLYTEFVNIEKDDKVIKPLTYSLFLYLYGIDLNEDEYDSSYKIMLQKIQEFCKYDPKETIRSLKRINIKYPSLYKVREELFTKTYEISEGYLETDRQYKNLINDLNISHSIKRLITLYLSDLNDDERESYFVDIIDEMSNERATDVIKSIVQLQNIYPSIYELNSDFFVEINKKLTSSSNNI